MEGNFFSARVRAVLKWNWSSDYSSEFWFVLPFVVLPSKRKRGINVDVLVSCAESRDQGRGSEKMRAWGERRRMGGGGSAQERNGKVSISLKITRHWQRLVLQTRLRQQYSCLETSRGVFHKARLSVKPGVLRQIRFIPFHKAQQHFSELGSHFISVSCCILTCAG